MKRWTGDRVQRASYITGHSDSSSSWGPGLQTVGRNEGKKVRLLMFQRASLFSRLPRASWNLNRHLPTLQSAVCVGMATRDSQPLWRWQTVQTFKEFPVDVAQWLGLGQKLPDYPVFKAKAFPVPTHRCCLWVTALKVCIVFTIITISGAHICYSIRCIYNHFRRFFDHITPQIR